MADIFKKLRGIIGDILQIGTAGPNIKNSGGILQIRDADDTAFARLQAAAPTADQDVVTKLYADTLEKPMIVSRQADCSSAIPNNTGTRGFVVVTTAGSGAVIGDVLYDDGSSTGLMTILPAVEGRTIAVTDSLTGGTISFEADSIYMWNDDGSAWVKIGDIGNVTGPVRVIQFAIDNTATQDSTTQIPAGNQVLRADVQIDNAYSGGATIEVGTTADADAFQTTTDNRPQRVATYSVDQNTAVASASVVRVTVGGAPAVGDGVVTVWYCNPNG